MSIKEVELELGSALDAGGDAGLMPHSDLPAAALTNELSSQPPPPDTERSVIIAVDTERGALDTERSAGDAAALETELAVLESQVDAALEIGRRLETEVSADVSSKAPSKAAGVVGPGNQQ